MSLDNLQIKVFTALRFPLIIGVVFIHSRFTDIITKNGIISIDMENFPIYSTFSHLISNIFARISVPLFFIISGYFFFYKIEKFDFSLYMEKIKRRIKTLIIPYILWNFIVIIILAFAAFFIPEMMSGIKKTVCEWSTSDWIRYLYIEPISYQFWFIRDLFIICLFSPIIYIGIKYGKYLFILLLLMYWIVDLANQPPGLSTVGVSFFSLGAFFSINDINCVRILEKHTCLLGILYVLFSIIEIFFVSYKWMPYFHNMNIILGISFVIALFTRLIKLGYTIENKLLTKSSFFVFAYHVMPLVFIVKCFFKIIQPDNDYLLVLIYVLSAIIIVLLGIMIDVFLEKRFPLIYKILNGGR